MQKYLSDTLRIRYRLGKICYECRRSTRIAKLFFKLLTWNMYRVSKEFHKQRHDIFILHDYIRPFVAKRYNREAKKRFQAPLKNSLRGKYSTIYINSD